jgi:hypothetical protein
MRSSWCWISSLMAVLAFSSVAFAQTLPQWSPRDLNGMWSRANPGRGGGTCEGCGDRGFSNDVPTMTPEGQAKFEANKPSYGRELGSEAAAKNTNEHVARRRAVAPGQGNDIVTSCNPQGFPRLILYPSPFEFIQVNDRVLQFFEWTHVLRQIWTDGREAPKEVDIPRWYGFSAGRWEGDTFIVDSYGFDDRTWVDHFGMPHSTEMRLQERWRRVSYDTLELSMTIVDPKIYTTPWVSETKRFKLQRREHMTYDNWYGIMEQLCAPIDEVDGFIERIVKPAGQAPGK